eukprot:5339836-Lingulodinium_polyedra.AAC.1
MLTEYATMKPGTAARRKGALQPNCGPMKPAVICPTMTPAPMEADRPSNRSCLDVCASTG